MAVSIVILTWNGMEYTKQCLESIVQNTSSEEYEVIVVDNGSTDGTVEYLEGLDLKNFVLIKNKENLGFTRGNNIAIERIKENDVVLLNNDTIILQKNWLTKMRQLAYQEKEIGIVGCRMINHHNQILHAGSYIRPDDLWGQQIGGGQKDIGQFCENREVESVTFACVYIKRIVLNVIGGLNERFFSYFEDTDYCLRARMAGFRIMYCGEATIVHYQNVSTHINQRSFSKMFLKSQRTFRKLWKKEVERCYERRVVWCSNIKPSGLLGVDLKNKLLGLDENKIDIALCYKEGEDVSVLKEDVREDVLEHRICLMERRKKRKRDILISYEFYSPCFLRSRKYHICYSLFHISDMNDRWIEYLKSVDEIWVDSGGNREFLRKQNIRVPIQVYPFGINRSYFRVEEKGIRDEVRLLVVLEEVEEEFLKAICDLAERIFGGRKVVVFVYVRGVVEEYERDRIKRVFEGEDGDLMVGFFINMREQEQERAMLYHFVDCVIFYEVGRGGKGMMLEAAACGLPIIMPERERMEILQEGYFYHRIEEIERCMREIFCGIRGEHGKRIREEYSYERIAKQMAERLKEL